MTLLAHFLFLFSLLRTSCTSSCRNGCDALQWMWKEEKKKSQFREVAVIGAGDWFTSDCHECGWVMLCLRFPTRLRSLIQFGSEKQLRLTKPVSYKERISSLRDFMSWVKYAGYVFFSSSPGLKLNKNRRLYINSNRYHKQTLHNTVVCQSATDDCNLKRHCVTKIFNITLDRICISWVVD